jgi:peroxiredoxin
MKTKLSLLALVAFFAVSLRAAESPKVGTSAPAFSATDSNGKTHSLSDYKGKYVVLEWFNPECPFVKKHYGSGNMQKLQEEFTGKGVIWLSVDSSAPGLEGNLSPADANKKLAELKAHSTALLLDPEGKLGGQFGATCTPHKFVINF